MVKSILGRSVEKARFHVGYDEVSRTGCHAEKDKAYMEVMPPGLYIKKQEGGEFLVPYSNVLWLKLLPE